MGYWGIRKPLICILQIKGENFISAVPPCFGLLTAPQRDTSISPAIYASQHVGAFNAALSSPYYSSDSTELTP